MTYFQQPLGGRTVTLAAVLAMSVLALASCGQKGANDPASAAKTAGHGDGDKHDSAGENKDAHGAEPALTLTTEETERAGIKLEAVKQQSVAESITVTATIRPDQDRVAKVAPRIEGRVLSAPARLGDQVRAGQTLASLDSVAVGEAHAAWMQAQTDLRVAESDFKRAETLAAEEIIPRKDFLRAQAERVKAEAAVRAHADRLRLLGGSTNGGNVSGFSVVAPFAGTIIEKTVTQGDLATPGTAMFTIANLSRVWIQADLPEATLAKVRLGAPAKVTVAAYPDEVFAGRVGYIGSVVSTETRTVAARIEVPNPDGRLKPEMFATAAIEAPGAATMAIAVPDDAIVLMQGQPTVFVHDAGAFDLRVVEPGERIGGRTLIKSGLKPGDEVVVSGAYALKARKLKSQLGHGH